ncbi:MAG: ROK family protein [Phycisphaerae bacterium]|nr:ROK family protein [Phycisphaerae bacterium]
MECLGIDIGGTTVKAALLRDGQRTATGISDPYERPDAVQVARAVADAASRAGPVRPDRLGLCLPGAWDTTSGCIITSVNVPGIIGSTPPSLLKSAGMEASSIAVFTDAHAAAFEVFFTEQLAERLLAVSMGTGIGAAVIDPGGAQLLLSGRSSGHLGQIDCTVHEEGREPPIGPDGGRGGLEAYCGLRALLDRYGGPPSSIVDRLRETDAPLRALARSLRIAHAMYRPAHIRLLGGIGSRLGPHLPALRRLVEAELTNLARSDWTLACAGDEFGAACGAARLAARAA